MSARWTAFAGALLIAGAVESHAQTPVTAGFRDFFYGTSVTGRPTGEKPESKLWWNDGIWWGSLFSPAAGRYRIHRFDAATHRWIDTGTPLDDRLRSKADVLWDESSGRLYVASHSYSSDAAPTSATGHARLYRYTYDAANQRYVADSGFPVVISGGRCEALTIAKDSLGRLWITYVESGKVKINRSLSSDAVWGVPADLPVSATIGTVSTDDISAIIAFGGDRIGVMWSNQLTGRMYFVFRRDDDPVDSWGTEEQVMPGGDCRTSCADDHINLKTDSLGRIFAAVKTSASVSSEPLIMLAVRNTSGEWVAHTVSLLREKHTRPIVLLDEEHSRLYVVDTNESGGSAYIKSSPLNQISFAPGHGEPFIRSASDTNIDDVTSTKQNVSSETGLLVLASDDGTRWYLHNLRSLGGSTVTVPAAPGALDAQAVSTSRVNLSWTDSSSSEDAFHIERSTGGTFSEIGTVLPNVTSYADTTVSAGTTYSYRVRARNDAGFSAYSNTAAATTPEGTSRIKDITFEDGILTDATSGVDRVAGTVVLDDGGAVKGRYAARIPGTGSSYLEENFTSTADLYLSFYLVINAAPASDTRVAVVMNGSTAIGNIVLRSTGRLRLRADTTVIGSESAPLVIGQVYRVGIHQTAGTGGNSVLQAFLSAGDTPFELPFAATAAEAWTLPAARIRIGPTGANVVDIHVDDVRLDSAAMPNPSQ